MPAPVSVELNMFIMTHPEHDRARVTRAFQICEGDAKAASALIRDPTWSHIVPPSATSTPRTRTDTPSGSGSPSKRAAEKEKGRKSMIYARRQGTLPQQLPAPPPTPTQVPKEVITILDSPIAPQPAKRKGNKRVVESGSEGEYSTGGESGGNGGFFTQSREDQDYRDEALKWLNTCELQELMELSGEHRYGLRLNKYLII